MKLWHLSILVLLTTIEPSLFAIEHEDIADNKILAKMFETDQADREPGSEGIDWNAVNVRDAERRTKTLELLRGGKIRTSDDFLHAAYIFQHGKAIEDFRLALSLAWLAASINPNNEDAKSLTASAWDRLLMNQGQPQWYGTQYQRFGDGAWMLHEVQEGAVSDEQRNALNVPTLKELKEHAKMLNDK
jgi:hypothetical protein